MSDISFIVGESVEIIGNEYKGLFAPIDNGGRIAPDSIWREAKISFIYDEGAVSVRCRRRAGGELNYLWRVERNELSRILRRPAPTIPLAESCVECKTQFPYPNEHNCSEGRVCYSRRSTYGWKYTFFGDKS